MEASETALVTGGSGPIGRAVVADLAGAGFDVVVGYHTDNDGATKAVESVRKHNRRATSVSADLTDKKAAEKLVEEAIKYGSLSTLVHAAGAVDPRPIEESSETIRSLLTTNVETAVNVTDPAVDHLREQDTGSIVMVSSVAALAGTVDTTYATAKAGLLGFVRALAREVGADGIRSNAVCPGPVDTPMNDAIIESLEVRRFRGHGTVDTLLDRYEATPQEVASAVTFLVTHEFVTGEVLRVDGGMTL